VVSHDLAVNARADGGAVSVGRAAVGGPTTRRGVDDVEHGDGEGEGPGRAPRAFAAGAWTALPRGSMRRIAAGVQPLRAGAAARGWSIWSVSWVWAGPRILRAMRIGGRVLRRVCGRAAARGASSGQPPVCADGQRQGVQSSATGASAWPARARSSARNGHDLDRRAGLSDIASAVALRSGADARHGGVDAWTIESIIWPSPRPNGGGALRAVRPRALGACSPE
jgi:hypothetical protein